MNPILKSLSPIQSEYLSSFLEATSYRTGVTTESISSWLDVNVEEIGVFTLEDMSIVTGLSPLTLRQYVREGKIVAHKKWREYMVTANEIARFLYQRETGQSLPADISVAVVIVDREYTDQYHEFIQDYKFFNILEVKDWADNDFDRCRLRVYGKSVNPGQVSIELMDGFNDFFVRVGLLPQKVTENEDLYVNESFHVNRQAVEALREQAHTNQKTSDALMYIRQVFGELGSNTTLLKMYRELMQSWYEYEELEVTARHRALELEALTRRVEELEMLLRSNS